MRALALITAALAACVDVSGSQRAALLGACTFSDECPSPLLCAAGRCRAQCRTDRDCVNDWRCLSAGTADQSVCYAPDDYANACVWSSQCRGGRVCGGDRVCRKQCLSDYDCRVIDPSLWCVAPGLCSSHPFLDGGVPTDVDLNLLSGAARPDAATSGDVRSLSDTSASGDTGADATADAATADATTADAATADVPPAGPAEMPTVVSGTGCGPRTDARSCTPGAPGCDVVEIQASREGTARCVRFSDGSVRCWGNGYANTLGIGGITPCLTPFIAQRLHGARALELGGGSGCAMFTRGVWCWGSNFQSNVGVGTGQTPLPTAILEAPDGLGSLAAGHGNTTCLVRPDGALRCWGQNTGGELGQGDNLPRVGPVTVPLTDVIAVAPGETHVCALRRDRTVWCWGANCAGQCGQAPSRAPGFPYPVNCGVRVMTPTQVPGLTDVQEIVAGRYFSCARLADRTVQCWGWNDGGALGRGGVGSPGDYRETPGTVMGITDATSLSTAQGYGACVLRADRTVWCWGGDSNGGAMTSPGQPYQIPSLTDVRALAPRAPCVTRTSGEVWCWAGQIGDGMARGVMAATRVIF
jgi:hypothetical protein